MSITVSCSCGKRLKAPDNLAGKRVKCPACGTLVDIPKVPESTSGETYALAPEEDRDCPECGQRMKAEARRCKHCGFDTRTGQKGNQSVPKSAGQCPVCDGPLDEDQDCPVCSQAQEALGAAARQETVQPREKTVQPKSRSRKCPSCGSSNWEKISLAKKGVSAALRVGAAGMIGRILLAPIANTDPFKTYQCKDCAAQW